MKLTTLHRRRMANLRWLIVEHSREHLAWRLGYRHTSFLSQMAGPNPSRVVTEKTARKIERVLKLVPLSLDQ